MTSGKPMPCPYCDATLAPDATACATCGRPIDLAARVRSHLEAETGVAAASTDDRIAALEADVADLRAHNAQLQDELAKARAAVAAAAPSSSVPSTLAAAAMPARRRRWPWALAGAVVALGGAYAFHRVREGNRAVAAAQEATVAATTVAATTVAATALTVDPTRPVAEPDEVARALPVLLERGKMYGRLVQLKAEGVRPDGTLDPHKGELSTIFQREVAPAEAPLDSGGGNGNGSSDGGNGNGNGSDGGNGSDSAAKAHECYYVESTPAGAKEDRKLGFEHCRIFAPNATLYRPRCTMKSVWAIAKQRGAPDGLAQIEYRSDGAWWFFIYRGKDAEPWSAMIADACR